MKHSTLVKGALLFFGLMLTITTFLFTAAPAFAYSSVTARASSTPKEHVKPNSLPPQQCLIVAVQSKVDSSQTYDVTAHATNTCGFKFTVSIRINSQLTNCPPFSSASAPFSVALGDNQTAAVNTGFQGGCVVCTDHVPTAFPSFTVRVTAFAFGTVSTPSGNFQATSNTAAAVPDLTLSNNPHPFVPPCP